MRIRIIVAYVGTAYSGWQRQSNAPSVQAAIEGAASGIAGVETHVHGASRTDAGVHARGQVAHFDAADRMPPEAWRRALNANLPADLRIMDARATDSRFHARHSARGKTYSYRLDTGSVASPFRAPFSWHAGGGLDAAALEAGAAALLGPLDQRAFASRPEPAGRNDRPIECAEVSIEPGGVVITIRGRSFLRCAVRGMIGTLVEVGRGRRTPESVRDAALSGDRRLAGPTAPAHGLCLEQVHYARPSPPAPGEPA